MIITDYVCSQIDFPMCRFISKEVCKGTCKTEMINQAKINSPFLLLLLFLILGLTVRMLNHVQNLCSSIGRKEMTLFFGLYCLANITEIILIAMKHRLNEGSMLILTSAQLILTNTCFFTLLVGSFTMEMYVGKWGMESSTILYLLASAYCFLNTIVIFFSLFLRIAVPVFVMAFCFNLIFGYFYFIIQIRKLNKNNAEIWAYGTLTIGLFCFMISIIPIFVGSELVSILTSKYLDNLFFQHLFLFCSVVMVHKFWLSVCDYEVECYLLEL